MRFPILLLLAATLTAGCAASADEPDSSDAALRSPEIIGGEVEEGYPAVGMLRFRSGSFGTGTLIAPQWVLTAAHVALGNPTSFFYGTPAGDLAPVPENLTNAETDRVEIHPCYPRTGYTVPASCPKDPVDVALVHVKAPITDVAPLPIVDSSLEYLWGLLSPYEGDRCVAVGFGAWLDATNKAEFGTRRSATSFIKSVGDDELQTVRDTGIASSGDSGGPLLCNGKIVATVRGSAGAVPKTSPYDRTLEGYERTDRRRDWIATTIR